MDDNRSYTSGSDQRTQIDTLCWLIEDAFSGDLSQSLLKNLANLREQDWTAVLTGGGRSIADIIEHVGWCKWMYENYAFGNARMRGDIPPLVPEGGARSRPHEELIAWLTDGHAKWLSSVLALQNDAELERDRLTNWGERMKTRTLIRIMIGHDYYHAGEINHLRAVLQGNDRWEYE
jgi:hypothetical protein